MAYRCAVMFFWLRIITGENIASSTLASTVGTQETSTVTTTQAPPTCSEPTPPENGTVVTWGNNLLVEYTCDEGLFPIGRTFGSCDRDRKRWSIQKPLCVSYDCDHPGNITNGRLYFDHNDAVVITTCDPGYKLVGSRSRHCNGFEWVGPRTRCLNKYMARNPLQANGTAEDIAILTNESYSKAVLNADNTCSHVYTAPAKIANGTHKVGYGFNKVRRQWVMVINYTCNEGFTLANKLGFYKYCKEYKWKSTVDPQCIPVGQEPPSPCDTKNGGCAHICVPHGGDRFNCDCRSGFTLKKDFKTCTDVDECRFDNGGCEHFCHNLYGSYFCTCSTGYVLSGHKCLDEDECASPRKHRCMHGCINTRGSYMCNCSVPGYTEGWDDKTCVDVDECNVNNGGCEYLCVNTEGSYKCKCTKGYTLSADNSTCEDVDECMDSKRKRCKGGVCTNTEGSFICECNEGYKLRKSKRKCVDIDECASTITNICDQRCINAKGYFHCDCVPGHALVSFNTCAPCPVGYYRSLHESECTPCPAYATTNTTAAEDISDCECLPGFHGNTTIGEECVEIQTTTTIKSEDSTTTNITESMINSTIPETI